MSDDRNNYYQFISLSDFEVPVAPVSDAARGGVKSVWVMLLGLLGQSGDRNAEDASSWTHVSSEEVRAAVAEPTWERAAEPLANQVGEEWFRNLQPSNPWRVVVGPPGTGIAQALREMADTRKLRLLEAPETASLLDNTRPAGLPELKSDDDVPIVIPNLERWFVRMKRTDSLACLIEQLVSNRPRIIFGCDSWAWQFLQQAVGIEELLGQPLTLAPFHGNKLDRWLRSNLNLEEFEFRRRGDGVPLFGEENSADKPRGASDAVQYIKSFAARSRGNPGVALALWRANLRRRRQDPADTERPQAAEKRVLWVQSPLDDLPNQFSGQLDRLAYFILHALLLHAGLSQEMLVRLMPFSRNEVLRHAGQLRNAGLITDSYGSLVVKLSAYPFVRHALESEGFLIDRF